MNFNVQDFNLIIDKVVEKSDNVSVTLDDIVFYMDTLIGCLNQFENKKLVQGWNDVLTQLNSIKTKYSQRKEEFLRELENYRINVLENNDETYKSLAQAMEILESISSQIDGI